MESTIHLRSRRGEKNYLKKIRKVDGEESKTFLLKTSTPTFGAGYTENKKVYVNPAGGPLMAEGEILKEADAKIKFINFIEGRGCFITFE
jgi:hypothetical protein